MKYGSAEASFFIVSNGVRQGGVIYEIFFSVYYINKLLIILCKSVFGCNIYGVFFGAITYADDIFLLIASRSGVQDMIDISETFASRMNLILGTNKNPDKSKTDTVKQVNINLNGCHLGLLRQSI